MWGEERVAKDLSEILCARRLNIRTAVSALREHESVRHQVRRPIYRHPNVKPASHTKFLTPPASLQRSLTLGNYRSRYFVATTTNPKIANP